MAVRTRTRTRRQWRQLPLPNIVAARNPQLIPAAANSNGHHHRPVIIWDAVPIPTGNPNAARIIARPRTRRGRRKHSAGWRPILPPIGYPWPANDGPFRTDQAATICDHLAANGPPPGWAHGQPYTTAQLAALPVPQPAQPALL